MFGKLQGTWNFKNESIGEYGKITFNSINFNQTFYDGYNLMGTLITGKYFGKPG